MENIVYTIGDIALRLHTHGHTQSTMLTYNKYVVKKTAAILSNAKLTVPIS